MAETELKPYRRGHYQYKSGEVLDVVVALPFAQGNVLKYIFRPGKGRYVEDLGKALFYLQQSRDTVDLAISSTVPNLPFQATRLVNKVDEFAEELEERGFPLAASAAAHAIRAFTARPRAARADAYANAEGLIKEQINLLNKLNKE